jgi:hypothetical protein
MRLPPTLPLLFPEPPQRGRLPGLLASLILPSLALGYQREGTHLRTDGSQRDVHAALAAAKPGQTVHVPAGSFTWGDGGSAVNVGPAVTLAGAGPDRTTIQVAPTAATYTRGIIRISGAATVRDLTIRGAGGARSVFSAGGSGWRITNITYLGVASGGYFLYAHEGYGLVDSCTLTGGAGNSELIFTRGPANSWQTPSSLGTADAVYIEDCTFHGPGYVSDFNANARGVVRFCTINGPMKVDAHGLATNTPPRSARHTEIYGNRWNTTTPWTPGIEVRGGTGMIFDNHVANLEGTKLWLLLKEYGPLSRYPNFGHLFQTPIDYPIRDQIGVGQDPRRGASEPLYLWNNTAARGADWPLSWPPIPEGAIELYRIQTGNPQATFTPQDLVRADRDYFKQVPGVQFDGSSGVGRGPKAEMLLIRPPRSGVGYWVIDEGKWNQRNGDRPDGQLYVWDGTAWKLHYRPYHYPHPLRR